MGQFTTHSWLFLLAVVVTGLPGFEVVNMLDRSDNLERFVKCPNEPFRDLYPIHVNVQ